MEKAPPGFQYGSQTVVPIDIKNIELKLNFDAQKQVSQIQDALPRQAHVETAQTPKEFIGKTGAISGVIRGRAAEVDTTIERRSRFRVRSARGHLQSSSR